MRSIKLKHIGYWLMAIIYLFGSHYIKAQTPDSLTLNFCRTRAAEVYPIIKQKILNEEVSALRLENTDKNYLPRFDLNGRASYQSDVTKVPLNIPGMQIPTPDKDVYDLYLGLNQLIWDGGSTKAQKHLEEAELNISLQQIGIELYKVKERVNGLFYKILLLGQNKDLVLTNRQLVNDKLREIEAGIRNGMVLESNADVLKAQILQIDQNVSELSTDIESHYKMLSELLEMHILPTTKLVLPHPALETDTYTNQRPEYELLNMHLNKLELSKNLISSAYMPKFSGFGKLGYGKPGLNMLNNEFDSYYYLGIGLSWDIINWNKQKNQKKLLDLQKGIVETEKAAFDKNVKMQVEDDMAQITKFKTLIIIDEEIIVVRERITKTSSSQLDNGTITPSQYLDELNRETQSRINLEMHRIQLSLAKVNYLNSIGKL